jgi:hypothetical protein
MQNLSNSSRKIADAHLHTQIRDKESCLTQSQVDFSNDLDVLLGRLSAFYDDLALARRELLIA